jgi:alpha-beta hydrolase superfamily lysophospholipase
LAASASAREDTLTSKDGTRLHCRSWTLEKPRLTLAVVPGLGEHSGRYADFAASLAAAGIATSAVDLRGHGLSQGRRGHVGSWSEWVEDLVALVEWVSSQTSAEVVPFGHSFGGAILLSAVIRRALVPRRFVVSSPALRAKVTVPAWMVGLAGVSSRLLPRLALSNQVDPALLSHDPAVVEAYRGDPLVHDRISTRTYTEWQAAIEEIMAGAGSISAPFLASHGIDDRVIDPAGTEHFFALTTTPGRELLLYPGLYHEPYNDTGRLQVIEDLVAWLDRTS